MTEEEVFRLVDRVISAKGKSLRLQKSALSPTPTCSPLPRLERGVRLDDWTEEERQHLEGCPACRRTLAIIQRQTLLEQFDAREAQIETTERS
jgi:hypothetical protein